ncbi:unnamed protein product [Calicophoron daubneyi]|uniref:Large ribosomal subunit protein mL44 n=1 Tax=Calicophoron daubneyi TaxID=300641 RepID=A0AAV2TM49_CALDB
MSLLRPASVAHFCIRYARSRAVRPYLRDLYYRRLAQGPEPYRPRSAFLPWDLDTELFAFQNRINTRLPASKLCLALTDKSYVKSSSGDILTEEKNQKIAHNAQLAIAGRELAQSYMVAFLRWVYPLVPEEWINDIVAYLLSPSQLAFIAGYLGLKDLVLYSTADVSQKGPVISAPPSLEMMSNVLLALIAALAEEKVDEALLFIRDFLLTQLADLDITGEMVPIENPMRLLSGVLAAGNRPPPEPRLQWQSSMNTLLACYQVGIYSGRELLGEAPGETIEIAVEESARQSLRNLFGLSEHRPPIPLCGPLPSLEFGPNARRNVSVETYLQLAPAPGQPIRTDAKAG